VVASFFVKLTRAVLIQTSQWKNGGGALGDHASAEDGEAGDCNHPKQSPHSGGLDWLAALGYALELDGWGHAGLTVTAHFGVPAKRKAAVQAACRVG